MPYKKTYRRKPTYRKKPVRSTRSRSKPTPKLKSALDKTILANDLSGFDKAMYKTDRILNQIGHGFSVLGTPIRGAIDIASNILGKSLGYGTLWGKGVEKELPSSSEFLRVY